MANKKKYWLGLALVSGLGPVQLSKALKIEEDPARIWRASRKKLKYLIDNSEAVENLIKLRENLDLEEKLKIIKAKKVDLIARDEADYPEALLEIHDPPPLLFVRGKISASFPAVAVVGSRKSTGYGEKVARELAGGLAMRNIVVVSGMAHGIDREAHLGALNEGGRTIAVLGSGHDHCYPRQNRDIFNRIPGQGAVISEFPPDVSPRAGNFPRRNRIISGMSQGVVVVEAAEKSGALITAGLGLDQNRDVLAVPGNIDRASSRGCNDLLRQGAVPVTCPEDIINHLYSEFAGGSKSEKEESVIIPPAFSPLEKRIIGIFNRERELTLEELIAITGREAGELSSLLVKFEVKGIITRRAGQKYCFEGLQSLLKPI